MGHVLGQDRSSASFPCSEETLRFEQRYKSGRSIDLPYLAPVSEFTQAASIGLVGEPRSSENIPKKWLGSKSGDGDYDELVRHMSNLPGFLQQVEKENSVQEKALNFGVLEWKRLEKWKYNERMPRKSLKKPSSTNPIPTSGPPKMNPKLRNHSTSHGRNATSFYSEKKPLSRTTLFSSPPRQPYSPDTWHVNPAKEKRNPRYHSEEKYGRPVKSKGKETFNQDFRVAQSSTIGSQQYYREQGLEPNGLNFEIYGNRRNNNLKDEVMSGKEVSLSELGKHKFSVSSTNKVYSLGKKSGMQSDGVPKVTNDFCHAEPFVLPVPDHFQGNGCFVSFLFMESRSSVDGQSSEVAGSRVSDFSPTREFDSGELSCDTSQSCPLPSVAAVPTQFANEQHNLVASSKAIGLDSHTKGCQSVNPSILRTPGGKDSMMRNKTTTSSYSVEASKKAPSCTAEKPVAKGRPSSPMRRLSFDLGRVGRSFSFKDSPAVPELNSTDISAKSGKVRPGVRSTMDNIARNKEIVSGRGRSSPLRRLLDPLLKHKGSESAEAGRPSSKISQSTTARASSTKRPSQDSKPEASVLQALLQVTLKNGRPCFKLVVDNSEDMLAAGVKILPTPGKSDPYMIYTFYSVREIRKKGMNWISQGSKSKNCSLGYDVIGQMKISNSHRLKENSGATECVLYGINPGQVDKQALESVPGREIAAIIVKTLIQKQDDGELCGRNQLHGESEPETSNTEETKKRSGTTVILPGGIHGIPVKGGPSSLTSRWKSGGLCDCGGWDVGCKLRILSEHNESNNICHASTLSSDVDGLTLSLQSVEQKNKHVFSLAPLGNGLYSIEFDKSISLSEAFATCVAYVTCRKFPEIIDAIGPTDEEDVPEATTEIHERKTPTKLQDQLPAQNMSHPCPPLSPAARI